MKKKTPYYLCIIFIFTISILLAFCIYSINNQQIIPLEDINTMVLDVIDLVNKAIKYSEYEIVKYIDNTQTRENFRKKNEEMKESLALTDDKTGKINLPAIEKLLQIVNNAGLLASEFKFFKYKDKNIEKKVKENVKEYVLRLVGIEEKLKALEDQYNR